MPAEWEPHRATHIAWPHKKGDWPGKFGAIPWAFSEMARQLSRGEQVSALVASKVEQREAARILQNAGCPSQKLEFIQAPTDRSWTRDYLPLFVVCARRARELGAVKWRFNGWARYRDHHLDDRAGHHVARHLGLFCWTPEAQNRGRARPIVLEGGSVDVDGEGTLLASEPCLLTGAQARNRSLGRTALDRALNDYLGIDRVIWLGEGIAGDDTAGHVDDFVRFVGPATVVLCEERRRRDPNHRLLEAAREKLEAERDAKGRKLRIVRLPMPDPLGYRGQRVPASYANFYIGNEAVLVPTFNDVRDREALGILGELFAHRRVVGIHAVDLVAGLGTVHCSTQQEPLGSPAAIRIGRRPTVG